MAVREKGSGSVQVVGAGLTFPGENKHPDMCFEASLD